MIRERKFDYHEPTTTEDRIAGLYEELSQSPKEDKHQPVHTLKDYIIEILNELKKQKNKIKNKEFNDEFQENSSLLTLAVLSFFLTLINFTNKTGIDFIDNNTLAFRAIGLCFGIIYLGASIERSALFKKLWDFNITKYTAWAAFSALIIYSYGISAANINSVFGIDSAALPLTKAITTGLIVFDKLLYLFIVIAIFCLGHSFAILAFIKAKKNNEYDEPPTSSFIFLIIALIVCTACYSIKARLTDSETLKKNIYLIAHTLDFNYKNNCQNLSEKDDLAVIFIGANQSTVLIDSKIEYAPTLEDLFESASRSYITVPTEFLLTECAKSNLKEIDRTR